VSGDPRPDAPDALIAAPLPPHTLQNFGRSEIHIVGVELEAQST